MRVEIHSFFFALGMIEYFPKARYSYAKIRKTKAENPLCSGILLKKHR